MSTVVVAVNSLPIEQFNCKKNVAEDGFVSWILTYKYLSPFFDYETWSEKFSIEGRSRTVEFTKLAGDDQKVIYVSDNFNIVVQFDMMTP